MYVTCTFDLNITGVNVIVYNKEALPYIYTLISSYDETD